MKVLLLFIFLFFLSFIFTTTLKANENRVVINEFMANPSGTDTLFEWIELFNNSSESIDLYNWSIDGFSLSSYILEPNTYVVLVRSKQSFPAITNLLEADFTLLNTSDSIVLKDSTANIIDSISYTNPIDGKSFELKGPLCSGFDLHSTNSSINATNGNYLENCYKVIAVEETPNSFPIIFPNTIQISEIYPAINTGEKEWIEIYNFGTNNLNLDQIYLSDGKECNLATQKYFLSGEITVGSYKVFTDLSNVIFNDSGDSIYLCGSEFSTSITYTQSKKGSSFSRKQIDGLYSGDVFLTTPTPGASNIFESFEILSISDVRKSEEERRVVFEAFVNSPFGGIFADTLFVQDSVSGIKIYYKEDLDVEIGMKLRVEGVVNKVDGDVRVDASKIDVIEGYSEIIPKVLTDLPNQIGKYVYTEGTIVRNYATSFEIETNIGLIRVSIFSRTGIELSDKQKGGFVKVKGILYKDSIRYRILPFHSDDIKIISPQKIEVDVTESEVESDTLGEGTSEQNPFSMPIYYKGESIDTDVYTGLSGLIAIVSGVLLFGYSWFLRKDLKQLYTKISTRESFTLPKLPFGHDKIKE